MDMLSSQIIPTKTLKGIKTFLCTLSEKDSEAVRWRTFGPAKNALMGAPPHPSLPRQLPAKKHAQALSSSS
jgi:hypothetical protein